MYVAKIIKQKNQQVEKLVQILIFPLNSHIIYLQTINNYCIIFNFNLLYYFTIKLSETIYVFFLLIYLFLSSNFIYIRAVQKSEFFFFSNFKKHFIYL